MTSIQAATRATHTVTHTVPPSTYLDVGQVGAHDSFDCSDYHLGLQRASVTTTSRTTVVNTTTAATAGRMMAIITIAITVTVGDLCAGDADGVPF